MTGTLDEFLAADVKPGTDVKVHRTDGVVEAGVLTTLPPIIYTGRSQQALPGVTVVMGSVVATIREPQIDRIEWAA